MIERTENTKVVDGILLYQIFATEDFEMFGEKILKGTFGGYVCANSRLKNSWISSGTILRSVLENSFLKECNVKDCWISDIKIIYGQSLIGKTLAGK